MPDQLFEIEVNGANEIYITPLNKSKLYFVNCDLKEPKIFLNEQQVNINQKTEIDKKGEITFSNSDKKLIIKKRAIKRDRSRSPSTKANLSGNIIEEVEDKYKHIKSEVVWNSVEFKDKNKKHCLM